MSIQNYTRQDLTLASFMDLLKSITVPTMAPLINFRLNQLYLPQSLSQLTQSEYTQLKISKNLFKNVKMLFFWIVIQRWFFLTCSVYR